VSGPIQAIDVGFNAPVKKGQRVAKIDPAPFAVKVREAEASLQNAQAKVVGDRADAKLKKLLLERNRVLLARNLIAQNDVQNVVTYDVVIAVENPGLELKPGMTANVSITAAKRDQALRIPVRALRFRPDRIGAGTPDASAKEESAVYVLAPDGALRRVEVEAGIRDNQHAEVLNGDLHEGDPIVVGLRREGA